MIRLVDESWDKTDAVHTGLMMMKEGDGNTPSHLACLHGHDTIVHALINFQREKCITEVYVKLYGF